MVGHATASEAQLSTENTEHLAGAAQRLAATSAAAVLIALSWFNAVHSPAFDCVRAGAYLFRSRRSAAAPVVQAQLAVYSYGDKVTLTSRLSARP